MATEHETSGTENEAAMPSPPPLPNEPFWKTFLSKIAISARVLGKEVHRNKLKWFDLRRADYQLGKKAHENQIAPAENGGSIERLAKIHDRIAILRQPINSGPSFKEKRRAGAIRVGRVIKIQGLKLRRNQLFRKLGGQIRKGQTVEASLATEIEHSRAVADRVQTANREIKEIAAGTYAWARKPLLTGSILALIVCTGIIYHQGLPGGHRERDALFNEACQKVQTGDLKGANDSFSKVISIDPEYALAYNNRGTVRRALGDMDGALSDYNRAIELNPKDASFYVNRGGAKQTKGDNDGAMADGRRALEVDPNLLSNKGKAPAQQKPSSQSSSAEAKAWANNYRNAKFLSRAEFVKRVGPVHLAIRAGSGATESVANLESIIRTSATQHGITIASEPTNIELIVEADVDRSKITTTEYTDWGPKDTGYHMAYLASVRVHFGLKAKCRRGDKFVELDVYPCRAEGMYYGYMGDLVNFEATYAKAFGEACEGAFGGLEKLTDSDKDDQAAWTASLWPPGQDAEMHKNFLSPIKAEPGGSNHAFYGVTKFGLEDVDLTDGASKEFNAASLQQTWRSELNRNGEEVDSSSDLRIYQDVSIEEISRGFLFGGTVCNFNVSDIGVSQRNVVFEFNGELRRARARIWYDRESAIALPRDNSSTVQDVVNRSIKSAAKELALRR
jgi:tetratricopeptide (TPR) repeat protein